MQPTELVRTQEPLLEAASPMVEEVERNLLRLLAMIGELSERREQMRSDLAGLDQLLVHARKQKADLIQQVQDLGGNLPSWQLP